MHPGHFPHLVYHLLIVHLSSGKALSGSPVFARSKHHPSLVNNFLPIMCQARDADINQACAFLAGSRRFKGMKEEAQVSNSPFCLDVETSRLCLCIHPAHSLIKISLSTMHSQFPTGVITRWIIVIP